MYNNYMFENIDILIPEDLAILEPESRLLKKINSTKFNDKVLFKTNSHFHKIAVVENEIGRFLHYKNTYQAGFINTKFYRGNLPYVNYFLIPYLMNKNIKDILLIGLGTGKLVKDFEFLFEKLKRIDAVDIEENSLKIAQDYFDFKVSDKFNFILQDGPAFIRNNKKKYDLIVVDVANNDGIDTRFLTDEYLADIKISLKKGGIFVSNLCASAQFEHKDNKFLPYILKKYNNKFNFVGVYRGDYSDKVYYKAFFDIETRVIDITNVIFIASDKYSYSDTADLLSLKDFEKFDKIGVNIKKYLKDIYNEFEV